MSSRYIAETSLGLCITIGVYKPLVLFEKHDIVIKNCGYIHVHVVLLVFFVCYIVISRMTVVEIVKINENIVFFFVKKLRRCSYVSRSLCTYPHLYMPSVNSIPELYVTCQL